MRRNKKLERALRRLDEFRRDLQDTEPEELDCTELERRLQDVLNDVGCECMAEVLETADTKAPVLEYAGERWGNRRDSPSTAARSPSRAAPSSRDSAGLPSSRARAATAPRAQAARGPGASRGGPSAGPLSAMAPDRAHSTASAAAARSSCAGAPASRSHAA